MSAQLRMFYTRCDWSKDECCCSIFLGQGIAGIITDKSVEFNQYLSFRETHQHAIDELISFILRNGLGHHDALQIRQLNELLIKHGQ